jgi:hypothetical protein
MVSAGKVTVLTASLVSSLIMLDSNIVAVISGRLRPAAYSQRLRSPRLFLGTALRVT